MRVADGETWIVETEGFDPKKDVKVAAAERWVAAVNADGAQGRWRFVLAESVEAVRSALDHPAR